jgi:hypothetical protein
MTILPTQRFHMPLFLAIVSGFALSILSPAASAGVLEMKPGDKSIEGVKLATEATFHSEGKPVVLKPYATGIRKKKVALFWAKVYVGQIFSTSGLTVPPTSIEEAYTTLKKQPIVAITLTFLRDVSASRQKDGFEDSLQTNGFDPKADSFKPLFEAVEKAGEAKDTLTTTIILERRKDGSEWFSYESGKGLLQTQACEKGIIDKILSIWVGKPADSGMERLHKQFLGNGE